ncbi:MAG: GGDEF domain-containing protein, partial [Candidatus Omnitrophota bacterium]|nr:GGDEF domain-containing protein [Candidatus Omnitrophota bacterium]
CDLGAASLVNAKLYQETLDLAITDGLTGLKLRRYFLDRLNEELSRSLREGLNCSFLMIDIDNFKDYNDRYGHTAGDMVLKALADVLRKKAPSLASIGRYGGEEFCICLPDTSKEKAKRIAGDIKRSISEEVIELRRVNTQITVSMGLATFPDDAKVADELIQSSDQRLYKAKRAGKNRVIWK